MSAGLIVPLHPFRFHVDFVTDSVADGDPHTPFSICSGAFAECTGLEATMEPKTIKEGGRNYGAAQRAGGTTFATVILKRGISSNHNVFQVFNTSANGAYAPRMQVTINVYDIDGSAVMAWQLDRAMPVKFKFADLNARGGEVGIEELHLVHEGLWSVDPTTEEL
ncbi:MAG TPA: phage tail protein [Candidatus Elarobacter sp.]|nr:phage tail protein [Candidatus Elarobacter sp.]